MTCPLCGCIRLDPPTTCNLCNREGCRGCVHDLCTLCRDIVVESEGRARWA